MKKLLILATIILVSQFNSIAQNKPTKGDILKAIKKIKVLHLEENDLSRQSVLSEEQEMRFVKDKFTNNDRAECLAIVPMEAGRYYAEWIIFMYKNVAGYWTYGKWYRNTQTKIDIIDIDKDGIKEIITEGGGVGQGYVMGTYTILSIKNGKEEILYQNKTFDKSAGAFVQNNKPNDTISITIEVNYIDLNNDGIKEIEEKIATGFFESYNEYDGVRQKYQKMTNVYYLQNGKYFRKE